MTTGREGASSTQVVLESKETGNGKNDTKQANKSSGNGGAMPEGSRNPALLHLWSARESLKHNFMGTPYASP